jgi:hypothetical protein
MHTDDAQPQLKFVLDGNDVLVTAKVRVNNSPHVMWTGINIFRGKVIPPGGSIADAVEQHRVVLQYFAFQNRDLFTRSFKSFDVTWRLCGYKMGEATYQVEHAFRPDSAELLELLPKLETLAKQGRV